LLVARDQLQGKLEVGREVHDDDFAVVVLSAEEESCGHVVRGFILCGLTDLVVRERIGEERFDTGVYRSCRTHRSGNYCIGLNMRSADHWISDILEFGLYWYEMVLYECIHGVCDPVGCDIRGLFRPFRAGSRSFYIRSSKIIYVLQKGGSSIIPFSCPHIFQAATSPREPPQDGASFFCSMALHHLHRLINRLSPTPASTMQTT
jgi:hypothetical protein